MKPTNRLFIHAAAALLLGFIPSSWGADVSAPAGNDDPHYTKAGFFDIHVCSWPDRPQFFFALFSSTRFAELAEVEIFRPDGTSIGKLDTTRFRAKQKSGMREKRVFMDQFPTAPGDVDGWYRARITLQGGEQIEARDYVKVHSLRPVSRFSPENGAERIKMPDVLRWEAVPGARFYQVFITDDWTDGQLIHTSAVLHEPSLTLPPGLLQPGGMYSWRVHARDTDEDVLLGDFNSGSLSPVATFTLE